MTQQEFEKARTLQEELTKAQERVKGIELLDKYYQNPEARITRNKPMSLTIGLGNYTDEKVYIRDHETVKDIINYVRTKLYELRDKAEEDFKNFTCQARPEDESDTPRDEPAEGSEPEEPSNTEEGSGEEEDGGLS